MKSKLGIAVAVLIFDAALLLIVGAVMWGEPSSPADAAVGKGLMTLGVALGIPAFLLLALFDSRAHDTTGAGATRTERETA